MDNIINTKSKSITYVGIALIAVGIILIGLLNSGTPGLVTIVLGGIIFLSAKKTKKE